MGTEIKLHDGRVLDLAAAHALIGRVLSANCEPGTNREAYNLANLAADLLGDFLANYGAVAAAKAAARAEYAELVAAARALVDGLGLVPGQSLTATEPMVRLLRAVRGLEAQTEPAEVRDGTA